MAMSISRTVLLTGVAMAITGPTASALPPKYVRVTYPVVLWSGFIADPTLEVQAPQNGLVTTEKEFNALWKAWRPGEEAPRISFDSHFVVVTTRTKRSTSMIGLFHTADGDAGVGSMFNSVDPERQGFGYGIGVYDREKVKTIGGKQVPSNQKSAEPAPTPERAGGK
jgi:hypothetical protein